MRCLVAIVGLLLTGCATQPDRWGQPPPAARLAATEVEITVWKSWGEAHLPDPAATRRATVRARRQMAPSAGCGAAELRADQAALFDHLAVLMIRYPELWRHGLTLGPVALPAGCHGAAIVRGRIAETDGWLAQAVVGADGRLVYLGLVAPARLPDLALAELKPWP